MTTFFAIVIGILMILVVVSLVRGVVAFLKSSKLDLERDPSLGPSEMQLMQNRMMFARIKWQAAAIVAVTVLMAVSK